MLTRLKSIKNQDNALTKQERKGFDNAKKFFMENPTAVKLDRKGKDPLSSAFLKRYKLPVPYHNSFVKTENNIFGILPTKSFLGKGSSGHLKVGFDEFGKRLAVKIEEGGKEIISDLAAEKMVLDVLNRYHGITRRATTDSKEKIYLVQELIEGSSLLEFKNTKTELNKLEELEILIQCARLVELLHANGIFHGDIAQRNFMINDKHEVSIIDFGNALKLSQFDDEHQLQYIDVQHINQGGDLGTFMWLAIRHPESKVESGTRIHETADVFLFGKMASYFKCNDLIQEIIDNMTNDNPLERPKMKQVVNELIQTYCAAKESAKAEDLRKPFKHDSVSLEQLKEPDSSSSMSHDDEEKKPPKRR